MSWKKKEKELTPEEAIQFAKTELAPFWLGSPPLIAGVRNNQQASVVPLDPKFLKKNWLILFVDSTSFSGETAVFYIKEWFRRYHTNHLYTLIVYVSTYRYFQSPEYLHRQKEWQNLGFPVVIDVDGTLAAAFSASDMPKIILLSQNKMRLSHSGKDWLKETELKIQRFLREPDPGLPLLPLFEVLKGKAILSKDSYRMELGYGPKIGKSVKYFPSAFQAQSDSEIRSGHFTTQQPEKLPDDQIYLYGKWSQDSEKVFTSDPHAVIGFRSSASRVSFVAQSLDKGSDLAVAFVEVDAAPAYDAIAGFHLILDEAGRSLVKLGSAHLYHILSSASDKNTKEIILRFPQANIVPVGIYGFRFGEEFESN